LRKNQKLNKDLTTRIETVSTKLCASITRVRNYTDREFSAIKVHFDNLFSRVNNEVVIASNNAREIADELIKDVDHKLDEVVCQIVC
jgi:hypothetical protein